MFPPFDPVVWLDQSRPWHNIKLPLWVGEQCLPLWDQPEDTLAAMMALGEARGEGKLGMLLVLCVARNRIALQPRRSWYGKAPHWKAVLLKPFAFSCFLEADPNRALLQDPCDRRDILSPGNRALHKAAWESACECAFDVYTNRIRDLTDGSTHYHATPSQNLPNPPSWSRSPQMVRTITYGAHIFYREET